MATAKKAAAKQPVDAAPQPELDEVSAAAVAPEEVPAEPVGPPGILSLGNPWDRTYGIGEVPPSRHPQASKEN